MNKSDLFSTLNDIVFAEKDPDIITSELIKYYEDSTGRTLARGDPVRLFIDAIILAIVQQRNVIDHAAKMNLLAYATGDYLDHLGALLGVRRLDPAHSVTTLTATLPAALSYPVTIPAGTRLSVGSVMFAVVNETTIPAGETSTTLTAQCTQAGTVGNGYAPGQIRKLVDVLPFDVNIENVTESNGGTDSESDEAFRERIHIAPESFSVAGPTKAYEYYARSAASDIIDVAVVSPPITKPGYVDVYPLMYGGTLPSDEIIARVYESCNAENVRPDTDFLTVKKPEAVNYNLAITYWIDEDDATSSKYIQSAVSEAVDEWTLWQRKALGRDINPSELIHRVIDAGAKRCEVSSPTFRVLEAWQVAVCQSKSVVYGGLEKA